MEKIKINKIIRSRRRTLALLITNEGTLVVRAPYGIPLNYIEDMVVRKSGWIRKKVKEIASRPKPNERKFIDGEDFLYLGKTYRLQTVEDASFVFRLTDMLYISRNLLHCAGEVLTEWYKSEAFKIVNERCAYYSKIINCKPASVKINGAKRRFGSCGFKGNINFSWRLIMAPVEVIDYVVVHELVHLNQHDHSALFWKKVENILPDYKVKRQWLKNNSHLLEM